ncbi:MAG: 4-hydroxy-2-oxo-heptane,7-dioate aldolase [Planctomycetaceae bacterium]|nr:4-hydroxy-2-oxo-heptane,7-dioate aldolase [Planctomycetaceae bacterium]
MFENKVKELIKQNRGVWGVSLPDASDLCAKLTVDSGIDFLWVDLEHRPFEVNDVRWVPIICRQKDCACVVRVAGLDPQLIKKALDIGANCIMIPQVNTAEEARLAVQYAKYPPQGSRGISPLWTIFMDVAWDDYLPVANDETCIIVQVETPEGIRNLEAIASVEGVDVVFAGPTDLSASLGHIGKANHPEVQAFLADFPRRVQACGKTAGITFADLDACQRAYEQGYRFISFGSIVTHGMAGLKTHLQRFRGLETK